MPVLASLRHRAWRRQAVLPFTMISPQTVDQFCLWFSVLAPACVVLLFRRALFTVPLGAIIPWVTLWACGHLLADLDPERGGGIVDSIWLLFGWLPSLLYALALHGLRRLFLFLYRRYTLSRPARPHAPVK